MEVSTRIENSTLEVRCNGRLESDGEYIYFKNAIKQHLGSISHLNLVFINSSSIDSHILGYVLKLKDDKAAQISIVVGNAKLYNFLQYVEFDNFFDIKIKEYE